MLSEAEEKWAPDDDPVFQLDPPAFQAVVHACYDNLDQPMLTYDTFWEVYYDLRDRVGEVITEDIIADLGGSIFDQSAIESPFALADLKAPEIDMRNAVDVEDGGGDDDIFCFGFTVDNSRDQLY